MTAMVSENFSKTKPIHECKVGYSDSIFASIMWYSLLENCCNENH